MCKLLLCVGAMSLLTAGVLWPGGQATLADCQVVTVTELSRFSGGLACQCKHNDGVECQVCHKHGSMTWIEHSVGDRGKKCIAYEGYNCSTILGGLVCGKGTLKKFKTEDCAGEPSETLEDADHSVDSASGNACP